jgi:hypothetical protein
LSERTKEETTMMNEMTKLIIVLNTLGIAHTITYQTIDKAPQVWIADDFDVICNKYSYGGKNGLLEMWDRHNSNDPTGYLTAKDVVAYILENY